MKKEFKIVAKSLLIGKSAYKGIKTLIMENQTASAFNHVEPTEFFSNEAFIIIKEAIELFL